MERNRLIVALDTDTSESAYELALQLGDNVDFYKVGLGLLTDNPMALVEILKDIGKKVFLDLKLFDTASTVERAVRMIAKNVRPDFLTVHGDPHIVEAAVSSAGKIKILAITALTDQRKISLTKVVDGELISIVKQRAVLALQAGAHGLVSSPQEVYMLREMPQCENRLLVTPGIRPAGTDPNGQKRYATPAEAVQWGADYIVVGRPILNAKDPVKATQDILAEIASLD